MLCEFVKELNKLRKSSAESIDDVESFEKVKEYLHIDRLIEYELRELLAYVKGQDKKTLVLLCGNAGDGKSHLISFLKNIDGEHLIDGFKIHNDAAESDQKNRTAIQTLSNVIDDFSDNSLHLPGENMILAINLGILSNFIESEEGRRFTELSTFVRNKYILTGQIGQNDFDKNSNFQYISFGDYNLFSLSDGEVKTEYLKQLIEKACDRVQENPFYKIYCKKCGKCPLCSVCVVRHNFEFLCDTKVQDNITQIICETIIKDKSVISTREVFDFIYDILVHYEFDYNVLCNIETTDSKYLLTYVRYSLPMLLYEYSDRSPIINSIIKYDILRERSEPLDESAIKFSVVDNIEPIVKTALEDTPYINVLLTPTINNITKGKNEMKSALFKMITRLNRLKEFCFFEPDSSYLLYLKNLYWFNRGQRTKLANLYQMVIQCVFEWNGKLDDNHICINNSYNTYAIFQELKLEPHLVDLPSNEQEVLNKFVPCITVSFKKSDADSNFVSLDIDYSLFKMLLAIKKGYKPTVEDRNKHADFIAFIDSLMLFGNASKEIFFIDNRQGNGKKSVFRQTAFGYEFKVI